jgi:YggT family protein
MIAYYLVLLINFIAQVITLLMLAYAILSWVAKPWNQIRVFVDRISEPMLAPIRRVVPLVGMVDISPLVLILLVQLIARILVLIINAIL